MQRCLASPIPGAHSVAISLSGPLTPRNRTSDFALDTHRPPRRLARNLTRCLINALLTLEVIFSIRCPKISFLDTNGKMWSQHLIILGYFQLSFNGKLNYSLHWALTYSYSYCISEKYSKLFKILWAHLVFPFLYPWINMITHIHFML